MTEVFTRKQRIKELERLLYKMQDVANRNKELETLKVRFEGQANGLRKANEELAAKLFVLEEFVDHYEEGLPVFKAATRRPIKDGKIHAGDLLVFDLGPAFRDMVVHTGDATEGAPCLVLRQLRADDDDYLYGES